MKKGTSANPSSVILNQSSKLFNVTNVLYENRYCNQDDFSILVCGGYTQNGRTFNGVYKLKPPNLEFSEFPSMLKSRYDCKTAVVNSDIIVVGGYSGTD